MAASTWGDLFTNLGFGMGATYLSNGYDGMHIADTGHHLYYFLNGKPVMNPANIAVASTDRLLVWYGTGSAEEIEQKWESLTEHDAAEYNKKNDPASCSSNTYGWLTPFISPLMEWTKHHM